MNDEFNASDWRQMYFYGVTKNDPKAINLPKQHLNGLLSMVGINAAISTSFGFDPKYIINNKGLTIWLAMYTIVHYKRPEALETISAGEGVFILRQDALKEAFDDHINWPKSLLDNYDFKLADYEIFLIPFLMPKLKNNLRPMSESLKSADESLEIFGFSEFDENNPIALLEKLADTIKFIKSERADIVQSF